MLLTLTQERYDAETRLKYQENAKLYDPYVTVDTGIMGDSKKYYVSTPGGEAQSKAPFGMIPLLGGGATEVTLNLDEVYAGDRIDPANLNKTNVNQELIITANTHAAIGRATNKAIRAAAATSNNTNNVTESGTVGMTLAKVDSIWSNFSNNRYFENSDNPVVFLGTKQWIDLMNIDGFSSADKIGFSDLPGLFSKSETGRFYKDIIFKKDVNLDIASRKRKCIAFAKSAMLLGYGNDLSSMVERIPGFDYVMYWTKVKVGATILLQEGVMTVECYE